jgi:glycerol-3-phosphate dehydrogenase
VEPALSENLIAAYAVQDGAVDPFMLSLDNISQGLGLGSSMRRNLAAVSMEVSGGRITRVRCRDISTGAEVLIEAELVINASGAWAGLIAALAGTHIDILYSMGSLIITQDRIATQVINPRSGPCPAADHESPAHGPQSPDPGGAHGLELHDLLQMPGALPPGHARGRHPV